MKDILERYQWLFLSAVLLLVVALWAPGLRYPIVSDTAIYALLGESLWHGNGYVLLGEPYAKHLPLHAFTSYPFVFFFGYNVGMKLATLLAGMAVVLLSFLIARRQFSSSVAVLTALFVALHHGFVWMTVVASADLLFTALFLLGVYAFLRAADDANWYLLAGLAWGLSCITRYNGMPLLALYLVYGLLWRTNTRRSMPYWCGLLLGSGIFGLWLLRNWRIFGDPFFTEYTGELQVRSAGPIAQIVSNFFYYLNPLQNILPILLVFAVYGLWKQGRQHMFLVFSMIAVLLLTSFWWVQAMRFAFPAYVVLIMFGAWGFFEIRDSRFEIRYSIVFWNVIFGILLTSHIGALCLYSSGACNAYFDRTVGIIPANLGLTSEGFYAAKQARTFINKNAPSKARVLVNPVRQIVFSQEIYRSDIELITEPVCPYYRVTSEPTDTETVLFSSTASPTTLVVLHSCQ